MRSSGVGKSCASDQFSGPEAFRAQTGVSRETLGLLVAYVDLLRRWQEKINLVGAATLDHLWHRHMLDSAQLLALLPAKAQTLVDLGSGGGFPGMVLSIMGVPEVHLVESNQRKATFLREAARVSGGKVIVHATRIEALRPFPADVVTARALAPLPRLVAYAAPFVATGGICVFPRGRGVEKELTKVDEIWKMRLVRIPSRTDPYATILRIGAPHPA